MSEHTCPDCGITYRGPNGKVLASICETTDRRVRTQEAHESQRDPV